MHRRMPTHLAPRPSIWRRACALAIGATALGLAGDAARWAEPDTAEAQVVCDFRTARFSFIPWKTDFNRCTVQLSSFRPYGNGRDGSGSIASPKFVTPDEASAWIRDTEPVAFVELGGEARAYPLQILIWHEVVNDTVGGIPIVVAYSPFTSAVAAYERQLTGRSTLEFGTTGNVLHSNTSMFDRQTESWWQQMDGQANVGTLTGARLARVPVSTISWSEFQLSRPYALVLSRDTGQRREYGRNPYVGADERSVPLNFDAPTDSRARAMERVVSLSLGGETAGYRFATLREARVLADTVGGLPIVIFFDPSTISVLDRADIASSHAAGSTGVFSPILSGGPLTFVWDGAFVTDLETGSRWTILGQAISGPLSGSQLQPIAHLDAFWAPTAAFYPEIRLWTGQ